LLYAKLIKDLSLSLIFSKDFEAGTNKVLKWLDYYEQANYRVNAADKITCKFLQ